MFSVIIPAFNCEDTVAQSLDSVIGQTRFDLIDEIIIINDGSTDKTDTVIKEYIKRHNDCTFKYLTQSNHGVSFTRNRAINMAVGDWIALLDSDDEWKINKIERQEEIIRENSQIVFLGSQYPIKFFLKEYKSGLHKINARQLCIRNMPTTPSAVFKRQVGIELGLYNEQMKYGEDINFFQKFILKDSMYILAEELVNISIGKKYWAETGLSSNLLAMHRGRNQNTVELYEMHLISLPYLIVMLMMNQIKYYRNVIINRFFQMKYRE